MNRLLNEENMEVTLGEKVEYKSEADETKAETKKVKKPAKVEEPEPILVGYLDVPDTNTKFNTRRKLKIFDNEGKALIHISDKPVEISLNEKTVKDYMDRRFNNKYFGEYKAKHENFIPDRILNMELDIVLRQE